MDSEKFASEYTCRVGGEAYDYSATYQPGASVAWQADVSRSGIHKAMLMGEFVHNQLAGDALQQIVRGVIEAEIEAHLGIQE